MLITTDFGHKEDTTLYSVGGKDIFLPIYVFSSVLNLDVDFSNRQKPFLFNKDKSVCVSLTLDSNLANVNGEEVILPHKVFEHKGVVLVPAKYLCNKFGYTLKDTYNNIHISKN